MQTNTNALKLKKAQNELANIYLKEQREYIKIRLIRLETQLKIDNDCMANGKRSEQKEEHCEN